MNRKQFSDLIKTLSNITILEEYNKGTMVELEMVRHTLDKKDMLFTYLRTPEYIPDFLRMISACAIILPDLIEKTVYERKTAEYGDLLQDILLNKLGTGFHRFVKEPETILKDLVTSKDLNKYKKGDILLGTLLQNASLQLEGMTLKKVKACNFLKLVGVIEELREYSISWSINLDTINCYESEIIRKLEMID